MSKKERIRLLIGIIVITLFFCAIASIGWTKDEFMITYFYGFDGKNETQIVKKGYVKEPLDPGRYGYVFDGWYYTDKQGNEILFDFETERITTDLELTAHWKPFETEFLFDPNGGECKVESMLVAYGNDFVLPKAEKTGYYFVGWGSDIGWLFPMEQKWEQPIETVHLNACWSKFKPGTVYRLGEYENTPIYDEEEIIGWQKEKIEWVPIDKKDGKYLLVTKDIIDYRALDSNNRSVRWSECELRRWLNEDFYINAFSDEEKALLCDYTDVEFGSTDKVFLLSLEESKLLWGLDRYVSGTKYAQLKGLEKPELALQITTWFGETYFFYSWLTRTYDNGRYWSTGNADSMVVATRPEGIRPAIWVDADKLKKQYLRRYLQCLEQS